MSDVSLELDWDISNDGSGVVITLSRQPHDDVLTQCSVTGSDLIAALWDDVPPFVDDVPKPVLDRWEALGRVLKSAGEEITSRIAIVKKRNCIL